METQYKKRISYMYFSGIRITGIRKNVFNGVRIQLLIPTRMSSTQTLICIKKHFMSTFSIKHQQRQNLNPDCISKECMPFWCKNEYIIFYISKTIYYFYFCYSKTITYIFCRLLGINQIIDNRALFNSKWLQGRYNDITHCGIYNCLYIVNAYLQSLYISLLHLPFAHIFVDYFGNFVFVFKKL